MTEKDFVNMMCAKATNLGIHDSLCDPWDCVGAGDHYISVKYDIRKLIEVTIEEYKQVQQILTPE